VPGYLYTAASRLDRFSGSWNRWNAGRGAD